MKLVKVPRKTGTKIFLSLQSIPTEVIFPSNMTSSYGIARPNNVNFVHFFVLKFRIQLALPKKIVLDLLEASLNENYIFLVVSEIGKQTSVHPITFMCYLRYKKKKTTKIL